MPSWTKSRPPRSSTFALPLAVVSASCHGAAALYSTSTVPRNELGNTSIVFSDPAVHYHASDHRSERMLSELKSVCKCYPTLYDKYRDCVGVTFGPSPLFSASHCYLLLKGICGVQ
ncbi:hypothetical protein EDB92DRAFT_722853 [Lactarius akahatsu]|uniref:Secreted protein n=1 Tax=Lactarius akahatsu TaxID=416441 RepID=A0AAD4LIM8_9AGAM|nr:hypothetical protein EDB92DRAFT_722853 [Lactarius akahatsu]